MEKILPVADPVVDAYNNIANTLSIIQSDDKVPDWLHTQFIQIYHDHSFENNFTLSFYAPFLVKTCPWLDTQLVQKRLVEKGWGDITRFLIDCIDLGSYVTLVVDQYYIPNSIFYQKSHSPHELFIFGYHLNKNIFYVADNFANGKYVRIECSFDDLSTAYSELTAEREGNYNNYDGVILVMSKKENVDAGPFNTQLVLNYMEDYLYSRDSSVRDQTLYSHFKLNRSYGMQCYENLVDYVNQVCDRQEYLDIRPFHVIYLHKKQMLSRIKHIGKQYALAEEEKFEAGFLELEKISLITRNLAMKYNFSKDSNLKENINRQLQWMVNEETNLLPQLIDSIRKGCLPQPERGNYAVCE